MNCLVVITRNQVISVARSRGIVINRRLTISTAGEFIDGFVIEHSIRFVIGTVVYVIQDTCVSREAKPARKAGLVLQEQRYIEIRLGELLSNLTISGNHLAECIATCVRR